MSVTPFKMYHNCFKVGLSALASGAFGVSRIHERRKSVPYAPFAEYHFLMRCGFGIVLIGNEPVGIFEFPGRCVGNYPAAADVYDIMGAFVKIGGDVR